MTHLDLANLKRLLDACGLPWTKCRSGFETSQARSPLYGQHEWQCVDDDAAPGMVAAERDLVLAAVNALPQLIAIAEAAQAWRDACEAAYPNSYARKQAIGASYLKLDTALDALTTPGAP